MLSIMDRMSGLHEMNNSWLAPLSFQIKFTFAQWKAKSNGKGGKKPSKEAENGVKISVEECTDYQ